MVHGDASASIFESTRRVGTTILDIAETRLALFSTDLQEAANRYIRLALWCLISVFFFGVGVLLVTLALIALFWDTHRLAALAVGGGLFLAASACIAALILNNVRQHRNLFAASLGELVKDREHLSATP